MTPELCRRNMVHLQSLVPITLVTTGRTGSDFLQSLLDGHPDVLTFNGPLLFFSDFMPNAVCARSGAWAPADLADEFIGRFINRFKSRYDVVEGKDRLGATQTGSLDLDTPTFRQHVVGLLDGQELTARNFLLAAYGAYHLCLGRDLLATRILFHHAHRFDEMGLFMGAFPNTSVIVTTRDPRANFVSVIEHGRELLSYRDTEKHLYHCLNSILADSTPCEALGVRYAAIRLEDVPREDTMRACAAWLGISFAQTLLESTWGGLAWYGDRLSPKPLAPSGWTPTRTSNNWSTRLSRVDQYVLNALMFNRLRHYGYPSQSPRWWDAILVPLLLCLPMRHERRFFTRGYVRRNPDVRAARAWLEVGSTLTYFALRVRATLRHYVSTNGGRRPFNGPWIGGPMPGATGVIAAPIRDRESA